MLSSVLRSKRAEEVNAIIRAFVRLRQVLATQEELARKVAQHDRQIEALSSTSRRCSSRRIRRRDTRSAS